MTNKQLYTLWGGLFFLCAALGFLPQPQGFLRFFLTVLAVAFFLPGGVLLARAKKGRDIPTLRLIRNLALASLGLTLGMILANFFSVLGSAALGDALYAGLVILSSPMVCSGYWLLSLFLWACLLVVSVEALGKSK